MVIRIQGKTSYWNKGLLYRKSDLEAFYWNEHYSFQMSLQIVSERNSIIELVAVNNFQQENYCTQCIYTFPFTSNLKRQKVILLQAATGVYDSLLRDIERAQAELSDINTALTNTGLYQVGSVSFDNVDNRNK